MTESDDTRPDKGPVRPDVIFLLQYGKEESNAAKVDTPALIWAVYGLAHASRRIAYDVQTEAHVGLTNALCAVSALLADRLMQAPIVDEFAFNRENADANEAEAA